MNIFLKTHLLNTEHKVQVLWILTTVIIAIDKLLINCV
jgi:hypothetical protein